MGSSSRTGAGRRNKGWLDQGNSCFVFELEREIEIEIELRLILILFPQTQTAQKPVPLG